MGRTARFEQIYVASLEAEPVEQETLTGVKSILTREIEAVQIISDQLSVANTAPTKDFSIGTKLFIDKDDLIVFDLKERGRASRFFIDNQLAIGTTNPTAAFQINNSQGATKVSVDLTGRDLMTVSGNLVASNLIISDRFITSGSNLIIKETDSNVITINGGIKTSNLSIGSNISLSDQESNVIIINGNVSQTGFLHVVGNISVNGNITITETATYIAAQDLRVSNSLIQCGFGNDVLSKDTALLMTPGLDYANVAIGFVSGDRGKELSVFQTNDYAGQPGTTVSVDDTKVVNVHVYGDIYTANNIGAHNTYPTHDLCIGSNVFFDDVASNVMHATGNIYATGVRIGTGGIQVGSLLTMLPGSETPVSISGNVQMNAIRTNGAAPSSISNLQPTDTFSIGNKIFANLTAAETLVILGNTTTSNLTTQLMYSSANVTIHADRSGGDSTSNALILRAGPTTANVSAIEIYGASTSNTHQNIRFKTKNTERVRITSNGLVGINTLSPTERLTVSGNIHVVGSNTISSGNVWGSTGNIAMRAYTSISGGETKVENIVGAGKGLGFYASTTPTMGTPKLTILESSNVGINVAAPIGRLHTSGGTVFLNDQPTYRSGYNHQDSSLVVTNTYPIVDTQDVGTVMHLTREGNATRDAVRASFKMSKYDNTSGASKARLGVYLSDDDYTDENIVMVLQGNQRVGIGTTQPSAHLEVFCTGIGNSQTNGILVHNHETPSGDAIIAMQTDINEGNAFTSYIQSDNDTNPTGWSVGVSGSNEFRITQNKDKVSDSSTVGLYINGVSRDVGIGTDVPRAKLEVNGNVVIGQQLTFSGLAGDEFGNTHIIERRYNPNFTRTELLLFKGNDASSLDTGPDRIRHIAGEHVFQTYSSSGETLYGANQILADMDGETDKPMVICDNGIVVVGGQRSDANSRAANTKLVVNGDIEFGGGGSFRLTGFTFSTTTGSESELSINIVKSLLNGSTRRPLTFAHEIDTDNNFEMARFDNTGRFGIGTSSPISNLHVYSSTTTSTDVLRIESPGTNKRTGILVYTEPGEGGYLRGFSNSVNSTTGLLFGVAHNSAQVDCIHLIHTSNVGVGTNNPARKLHVYDGQVRVENTSSNAIVEFKTTGGISNIYSDTTGNVYISPCSTDATVFLEGDVTVEGDLAVGGAIDLGNQVAIGLNGAMADTDLEVGGGIITNSNQVACKRYSHTFSVGEGDAKDIQIIFGTGAFYAKVIAILRRTDPSASPTVVDMSTMTLDIQGGTGDGTTSTLPVAIGSKQIFSGTNSYPWSSTVTVGKRGISIAPYNIDNSRIYSYDIFVELVSARQGSVTKITRSIGVVGTKLDDGTGGATQIVAFTY